MGPLLNQIVVIQGHPAGVIGPGGQGDGAHLLEAGGRWRRGRGPGAGGGSGGAGGGGQQALGQGGIIHQAGQDHRPTIAEASRRASSPGSGAGWRGWSLRSIAASSPRAAITQPRSGWARCPPER